MVKAELQVGLKDGDHFFGKKIQPFMLINVQTSNLVVGVLVAQADLNFS